MKYDVLVIGGRGSVSRKKIISALAKAGFRIATTESSQEALSGLSELKPRLLILGEGLGDSFEACLQLRRVVDSPIMMLSVVARNNGWVEAVEVAADFYMEKPFSYGELVAEVKALLRRYEQTRRRNDKGVLGELFET